jgi:hypothetical protein
MNIKEVKKSLYPPKNIQFTPSELFYPQNNPFSVISSLSLFNFLCDKISLVDEIPE